jgi:hypothetical protein
MIFIPKAMNVLQHPLTEEEVDTLIKDASNAQGKIGELYPRFLFPNGPIFFLDIEEFKRMIKRHLAR